MMTTAAAFRSKPAERPSPLRGVLTPAWWCFVRALEVQLPDEVSESGGLGAFDMRPRRFVELGYAKDLRYVRADGTEQSRQIWTCELTRWPRERFLSDPNLQYDVFAQSISLYHRALGRGDLKKPDTISVAGALAILHKGGRGALAAGPEKMFDSTRTLYEAARGAF